MLNNPATNLFADRLWKDLQDVLDRLDEAQSIWLIDYLAAKSNGREVVQLASHKTNVLIAYGSETGNSEKLARQLGNQAEKEGIQAQVTTLADVRVRQLLKYQYLFVICSTHGDGDPPQPISAFYNALMEETIDLQQLNYAVLALGDSTYEHFCATGKQIDERLSALHAARLLPRVDCDVDYAAAAQKWMDMVLKAVPRDRKALGHQSLSHCSVSHQATGKAYSRQQPLVVEVLENHRLSANYRINSVHHLAVAVDVSDFSIEPGDAVGVLVENPPALVAAVLGAANLPGEQPVLVDNQAMPLVQALRETRDLTIPGQRLLESWAQLANNGQLKEVLAADHKIQRDFLRTHQIIDLISQYPATPNPQDFVDSLRPLQPRLYDLANSQRYIGDELHLTVQQYRYSFLNRVELGIASDYLLNIQPGESIRIYPHANPRFRLPEAQDVPLILIADGTGIAPYRSFLQELRAAQLARPCWLVFSEQEFEEDFFYQLDWQQAYADGLLSHVDTVFYVDQPWRSLADPLLEQAKRFIEWLGKGAHLYLCGDRARLTQCEHSLKFWLGETRRAELWEQINNSKRIHRNLY